MAHERNRQTGLLWHRVVKIIHAAGGGLSWWRLPA